jgi:putative hemolysin
MPIFEIFVVIGLMLLNGFFAMSELAVVSSRRGRVAQMAESGNAGAAAALKLIDDPTRFLSTVQVGITFVGIFAGAYSGATFAEPLAEVLAPALGGWASTASVVIVVTLVTYVSLIVGELVPKRIALNNAELISSRVARFLQALAMLGAPIVWLLRISTETVIRLLGLPKTPDSTVSEEEVKSLIAEGARTGVFHAAERDMIDGVLRLADRAVRSIMTPRLDVFWIDLDDPAETIQKEISESGHSRFPAGRQSLEEFDGVVHAKDLLDQMAHGRPLDIAAALRKPLVVHEALPVLRLLEMFRGSPVHMAIVVDEYGAVEGLVTPTDILMAIAGDLPEDHDEGGSSAVRREDGSWLLDGLLTIDEVERLLEQTNMRGDADYETLAGFVLTNFGSIPKVGDHFNWRGLRFEIVDMDGNRIDRIIVTDVSDKEMAGQSEFVG